MKNLLLAFTLLVWALPVLAQADSTAVRRKSRVGVTGMPSVSFNRSRGVGFGGMGMVFFPIGDKPNTPASRITVNAQISSNKSWYGAASGQFFLFGDRLRLSTGGGYMDSRFQTYVDLGDGLAEVPFDSKGPFFFASPLARDF